MNDVMIDLETLGNSSNAAIVSIGAVQFDPLSGGLGAEFECVVDIEDAEKYGKIDASTVKWWLKQSDEARELFKLQTAITLQDGLIEFHDWLTANTIFKKRTIWGNGATFDPVVLNNAYQATNLELPWPYWGVRDVRTVVDIGRRILNIDPKKDIKIEGVAHNAVDDARHQAIYVSEIYKRLQQGNVKEAA
ncbi:MAG: 3'-5' exoribonuclease [Thalassotalea sp.]|nr:3'-5' exoribonuclease [Thalassotalea sp.]